MLKKVIGLIIVAVLTMTLSLIFFQTMTTTTMGSTMRGRLYVWMFDGLLIPAISFGYSKIFLSNEKKKWGLSVLAPATTAIFYIVGMFVALIPHLLDVRRSFLDLLWYFGMMIISPQVFRIFAGSEIWSLLGLIKIKKKEQ